MLQQLHGAGYHAGGLEAGHRGHRPIQVLKAHHEGLHGAGLGQEGQSHPGDDVAGVRREIQAQRFRFLVETVQGQARLHRDGQVVRVGLDHVVQALQGEHHPAGGRHAGGGQAGASAARGEGDPGASAQAHQLGHLLLAAGFQHRRRKRIVLRGGQLVVGILLQIDGIGEQVAGDDAPGLLQPAGVRGARHCGLTAAGSRPAAAPPRPGRAAPARFPVPEWPEAERRAQFGPGGPGPPRPGP